jgi:DNA polymerase III delta prime subunit
VIKGQRTVKMVSATDIVDDVPMWVWDHGGKGRIQLGTLALFAGRPGAGKSTAARWLASSLSTGALPGCWFEQPQNVAYIAPAEESLRYVVKPGLRAAEADMQRIYFPEVWMEGDQVRLLSLEDEERVTEQFVQHDIRAIIVDPLMDTIDANVDINRNNGVRAALGPWMRMADCLEGVAIGVVHLKKAVSGDVVAAINSSSAFGEVARAIFAFAKDEQADGERIMSQAKNSTGEEDLSLAYRIESRSVTTDSGNTAEVGRFVIIGDAARRVEDIFADGGSGRRNEAEVWLEGYLMEHGRVASQVVKSAGIAAGFSASAIERASKKLGVHVGGEGFPRVTYWSLPTASDHNGDATDATDATDVTDAAETAVASATSVTSPQAQTAATGNCPECGGQLGITGKCVGCIIRRANNAGVAGSKQKQPA